MWRFREVWSGNLGDMIFQSCIFFFHQHSEFENLNVNLLVGTVQYKAEGFPFKSIQFNQMYVIMLISYWLVTNEQTDIDKKFKKKIAICNF
jgi:hypothetical protein